MVILYIFIREKTERGVGGGVRYLLPGFFVKKMYGAAEQKCTWHVARVVLRVFYLVFFLCAEMVASTQPFCTFYPLSRSSRGNISTKHGGGHKTDAYLCILGFGWKMCIKSSI